MHAVVHGGCRHIEQAGQISGAMIIRAGICARCTQPGIGHDQVIGEVVRFKIENLILLPDQRSWVEVQMVQEQVSQYMSLGEVEFLCGEVGGDVYLPDAVVLQKEILLGLTE